MRQEHLQDETLTESRAHGAVRFLLRYIGEDPDRPGLRDTPKRVVKALLEMTESLRSGSAKQILSRVFDEKHDGVVIVRGVRFTSLCEHHMLPFTGHVSIGYLPCESGEVVGLSKLPRLVEFHARRPQTQERMTTNIAKDIENHLSARAVMVVAVAHHSCMGCRGVRQPDAEMVTSAMYGSARECATVRAEFLSLANKGSV